VAKPEYVEVAKVSDLGESQAMAVEVKGKSVLLAKHNGRFYATTNFCPHMHGRLSDGLFAGSVVTCPRHHSSFDVVDGHVIRWTHFSGLTLKLGNLFRPPRPLKTYPVKVEGDAVLVQVEAD
jgi:3-phenylpropionate/trans-cinnamate dioxygenase ferredoxin component